MLQLEIKSDAPDLEIVQNLVRAAINSEIKNLKRSIDKSNKLLKEFETKYQIYLISLCLIGQPKTSKVETMNM